MLVDDGLSRNGTYVNGERLAGRRRLRDGDALRFGETFVQFRAPLQGASHATAVAGDIATAADLTEAQRRVLVALCRPFKDNDGFAAPATNQQIAAELFLSGRCRQGSPAHAVREVRGGANCRRCRSACGWSKGRS